MNAGNFPGGAPIRVLINALHSRAGGGVTYLRHMLPRLAADPRLEVHILLSQDQVTLFQPMDERIRVEAVDLRGGWRTLAWEQVGLPGVARRLAAAVVFSPANYGSLFAPNHVILLRNALSVVHSEPRAAKRLYWRLLAVATLLSLLSCRQAISVSAYAERALSLGLHRLFKRKMTVCHHGVGAQYRHDPAVGREDFLLVVADIYVQKNLDTLVTAFAAVHRRFPQVTLRIAGSVIDTWYFAKVKDTIRANGLEQAVVFLGPRRSEELVDLYRRCLAFVFPSTAETFGMPLVEAMSCGAPICCSDSTAMPEIVGDAALLFDPLAPDRIAAALIRVIESPEERARLSRQALARAAAFSWDATARKTADVLVQAAGRVAR